MAAVFAGSPQLMGVIKLCTGWMVSSLPSYNDDDLLKRNENVSIQFYYCGISQELSSFSPKCNEENRQIYWKEGRHRSLANREGNIK